MGVQITPKNATNKKLTYKSSKANVVSVSTGGELKANKIGKAIVTIISKENSKKKIKIEVTVVYKKSYQAAKKITLNKTKKALNEGSGFQLKARLDPSKVSNKNVYYKSSNVKVVVNKKEVGSN